jgi:hypothetical protein
VGLFFSLNAIPQLLGAMAVLEDDPEGADRAWQQAERRLASLGPLADDDAASFVIGGANFRRAMRRIGDGDGRLAFTRWMEANRAEASFPAGLVAVEEHEDALQPVLVAVIPDAFVFVDEDGEDDHNEMVELGRFRRDAVKGVDVVDEHGAHVPEPWGESIDEPEQLCRLVVSWVDEQGTAQTDGFLFRSASVAWDAARRFRRFALPPLDTASGLPAPPPAP